MRGLVSTFALASALGLTGAATPALAKPLGPVATVAETGGVLELRTRDGEIVTL